MALGMSCAHVGVKAGESCGLDVDGVDLDPGATVVLGDMHGSREIPRFVGALACTLAQTHPLVLGLEMPPHPTFDAFLASDGAPAAKAALLTGPFWVDAYQDGRRSVAAFELLERVRAWQHQGLPLEVFFFDGATTGALSRDQVMANNVLAKRAEKPDATFVLMMGNLHARKTRGSPWKPDDGYAWLTSLLPAATVSLNERNQPGTAWVCFGSEAEKCGPQLVGGSDDALARPGIVMKPQPGFDGVFDVGTLTASPPAAFPAKAEGLDARIAALLVGPGAVRAKAISDYKHGDFAGCARRLDTIAEPSADDLYSHACCLARAGQKDAAFDKLTSALAHGFTDWKTLQADDDLVSLHGDPRWPKQP
jgi:hypothetical protein